MEWLRNIFPKRCILCSAYTNFAYPLCGSCEDKIVSIKGPVCCQCGQVLAGEETLCTKCRLTEFSFRKNSSLFLYRDLSRIILHHYKFQNDLSLARFFAKRVILSFHEIEETAFLLPVPCSRQKQQKKGWDQVSSISKIIERESEWSILDCLGKLDCDPQKELDFTKRQENLKGKFYMKRNRNLNGLSCVLFDDVYTTGATIESCSKILKAHGAKDICSITLFRD